MKQTLKRWAGISFMAVSVLTMGGTFMVQSATDLAVSSFAQQVLMADGGGDRPAPCPKGKCWSGDATA
jgi:hypothetical protein